jgi:hypothetical protein
MPRCQVILNCLSETRRSRQDNDTPSLYQFCHEDKYNVHNTYNRRQHHKDVSSNNDESSYAASNTAAHFNCKPHDYANAYHDVDIHVHIHHHFVHHSKHYSNHHCHDLRRRNIHRHHHPHTHSIIMHLQLPPRRKRHIADSRLLHPVLWRI